MANKHQPISRFYKLNPLIELNRLYDSEKISDSFILHLLYYVADPSTNKIQTSETLSNCIQSLTGWHKRSIEMSLKRLRDKGYIKRLKPKVYQVNPFCMNKKNFIYDDLGYNGLTPSVCPAFRDKIANRIKDHFDIKPIPRKNNEREKMLEEKIDGLEGTIDGLEGTIGGLEGTIGGLESKIDKMGGAIDKMLAMLSPEQKEEAKTHLKLIK